MKLWAVLLFAAEPPLAIRGFATVWRNADSRIVKQVTYPASMRFKPFADGEQARMRSLAPGKYEAREEHGRIVYEIARAPEATNELHLSRAPEAATRWRCSSARASG